MKYYTAVERNEIASFVVMWMNLKSLRESEFQKSKILYINAYIMNLKQWYLWTYLQGSNRGAEIDIESGLVDWSGGWREWAELRE